MRAPAPAGGTILIKEYRVNEKIIVGLVASFSAVGGVIVTQAFTTLRVWLVSKREEKVVVREKYEELLNKVNESVVHRMQVANCINDDFYSNSINISLEKVNALALLYFPELVEPTKSYRDAYRDYYLMLAEKYIPDEILSAGMQAAKEQNESFDLVIDKLDQAVQKLYECIQENAPKYAKA